MHFAEGRDDARAARLKEREKRRALIIAEIRRLTAENGGQPPGFKRFLARTGIRYAWIIGNGWPRWSDALKEAGFAPNPKTLRVDDVMLLAQLAGVVRNLGHIPVDSELATWRASGRPLATRGTFSRHFGGKEKMLLALKRWTESAPQWSDVAAMLADIEEDPEPEPEIAGAVYLLRHGRSYKIGCSRIVKDRVRELQQMLPGPARLVHSIATDDPHGVEAYWHRRFAAKRHRGEWFRLSAADVAAFRQRRFQ